MRFYCSLILIALVFQAMYAPAQSGPTIVRLDPRLDDIVPRESKLEKLADGFRWAEGPVWDRQEMCLLFSDVPNNQILKWKEGSPITVFLTPAGYTGAEPFAGKEPGSNGLLFDSQQRLIICRHGDRRISRLEKNDSTTTLVDRYQGKRLNSPNDLILKSNGDLYFTDPPFGLPETFEDSDKELDFQGIYRYSTSGELTLLSGDIKAPNGIAFSADEKKMYVSDPVSFQWFVFDVREDGLLANKRIFLDGSGLKANGPGGPDGMKVDRAGNIFSAGPGALYVIAPDASILGRFDFGTPVGNCAWGEDGSTLFITANTALYRIRLKAKGAGF